MCVLHICICEYIHVLSKLSDVVSWRVFATFWVRELKLLSSAAAALDAMRIIPEAGVLFWIYPLPPTFIHFNLLSSTSFPFPFNFACFRQLYSFSFTFINCHPFSSILFTLILFSSTFIYFEPLWSPFTPFHSFSSPFIPVHPLSSPFIPFEYTFIHSHSLQSTFKYSYWIESTFIQSHSLSFILFIFIQFHPFWCIHSLLSNSGSVECLI